jgi:uncharacterized RDD family membrane protein YckC
MLDNMAAGESGDSREPTVQASLFEGMSSPEAPPPAGPLRRTIATLVDMLVFTSLSVLLALPVARYVDWNEALRSYDSFTSAISEPTWISHLAGVGGLWTALWWAYFIVGWGLAGASPGKWLLGIRIVDHRGRYPIGASRAALRLVAYMISSVSLGFGHLFVVFRRDRRALHDILAGTRVVRRA